jgi:hypothetical protein
MRIFAAIVSVLFAAQVFAGTMSSHDYQHVLRGIELENACLTGQEVRTIRPVKVCTKYDQITHQDEGYSYTEYVCVQWDQTHLAFSRAFEKQVCNKYSGGGELYPECIEWITVSGFLPETIDVRVWQTGGETDTWPGEVVKFTFPTCK